MMDDTNLFDRMERWRRDGEGSRQSQDLFELENESDVDDDIAYSPEDDDDAIFIFFQLRNFFVKELSKIMT